MLVLPSHATPSTFPPSLPFPSPFLYLAQKSKAQSTAENHRKLLRSSRPSFTELMNEDPAYGAGFAYYIDIVSLVTLFVIYIVLVVVLLVCQSGYIPLYPR